MNALYLWLSHFIPALVAMLVCYGGLLLALLGRDIGKMTYWDELADEFRAFLVAQRIQICNARVLVALRGRLDQESYSDLKEFMSHYEILVDMQRKIQKLSQSKGSVIALSVILAIVYASIVVVMSITNGKSIEIMDTFRYLGPVVFLIFTFVFFLPIYTGHSKINSFISNGLRREKDFKDIHGDFRNVDEWVLKDE